MSSEPPFELVDTERAAEAAQRLFEAVRPSLASILPRSCEIRHVGATAIEGCLTKGDLDIVIRVPAGDFGAADAALAGRYERNEGSIRTDGFSGFKDGSRHPHLGIQLVSIGGPLDVFHVFAEALRRSPARLAAYNALKRRHHGAAMARYRAAKDAFIERTLSTLLSRN